MYLLLLVFSSNFDPSWSFAVVNLLAAALAWRLPSTRKFIASVSGLDVGCGLVFAFWLVWQDWTSEGVTTALRTLRHGGSGVIGILVASFVFSGKLRYDVGLPLRGAWAARFAAAVAIAMIHFSSVTYYVSLNLEMALGSWPPKPAGELIAAWVSILTLPGYYMALWWVLVEGRRRASSDGGEPQRMIRQH